MPQNGLCHRSVEAIKQRGGRSDLFFTGKHIYTRSFVHRVAFVSFFSGLRCKQVTRIGNDSTDLKLSLTCSSHYSGETFVRAPIIEQLKCSLHWVVKQRRSCAVLVVGYHCGSSQWDLDLGTFFISSLNVTPYRPCYCLLTTTSCQLHTIEDRTTNDISQRGSISVLRNLVP